MEKRVVILGGGESGVGAAILARRKGYSVFLSDINLIPRRLKEELIGAGIAFEEGRHSEEKICQSDEVIKSPGIPDSAPIISALRSREIPIISEIEFAYRYTKSKIIGVTGTNGKTTTTALIYHIMKSCGFDVEMAGNIGSSFARKVVERNPQYFVLELSSFQLDDMYRSRVNIGVLLNITPDHLDRYGYDMDAYVKSKFRIVRNMRKDDSLVCFMDDQHIVRHLHSLSTKAEILGFSLEKKENISAYIQENYMMIQTAEGLKRIAKKKLPIRGEHNQMNAMAAILATLKAGANWEEVKDALTSFTAIPHRMEFITDIKGISFYNDSKATNIHAVIYALQSFDDPIIWIAGGVDKGNDYAEIEDLVMKKVKTIITIGTDNKKIEGHFDGKVNDIHSTDSMFRAVEIAYSRALKGDVILLSPACASFDLFKNYEERGNKFKEAALALKSREEDRMILMI